MLYTIAVVLLILWLLGLVTSYTVGGLIHVLLVIALVVILLAGHRRPKVPVTFLDRLFQQRRYTMFQRILAGLMLLGFLGAIAGCNTMHGLGQDIERGGEKIQNKAAR